MEILAIVALNLVVYWRTIGFDYICDDIRNSEYMNDNFRKTPSKWKSIKGWVKYFPLLLYGAGTFKNQRLDHLLSIGIHSLICVLMYIVFGMNSLSFAASLLYAVNPSNNQLAIWCNGRRYACNIVFLLLMMLFFPYGLILYPLSLLFQVNIIFAPILFAGHHPLWLLIIPIAIALGVGYKNYGLFGAKLRIRRKQIPDCSMRKYDLRRLVIILKCYGFYTLKMLLPIQTFMVYPFLYGWGMNKEGDDRAYRINGYFWAGLASFIATLWIGVTLWDNGFLFYMWAFMFLSLLQWCQLYTVTQTVTDRYMGVPLVFFSFFVVYALQANLGQLWAVPVAFLIGWYIARLQTTFKMYKNLGEFYDYHIYFDPAGVAARGFKTNELIIKKDYSEAWHIVRHGLARRPKDFKLLFQAATLCLANGELKQSEAFLNEAEKNHYIGQGEKNAHLIKNLREGIALVKKSMK